MTATKSSTTGIYRITCSKARGAYIGQSVNVENRWLQHKDDLKDGTHHNHNLQRLADRHGINSLKFAVVAVVPKAELDYQEALLIQSEGTWNTKRPNPEQMKGRSGSKAKKKFRLSSGIKFVFLMVCGALGFAVLGVIGFWICVALGAIVTWGN